MDFSSSGYMGGGVALPTVATVVTVNPSGGDDTTAIKNAISTVAARSLVNGFRGAVQLGAGTFHVSSQININASGVIVRGAGSTNGTTIVMTGGTPFKLFYMVGSGSPSESGTVNITDSYVASGTNGFNVSSATGFSVGNTVILHRTVTTSWINFMGMQPGGSGGLDTNQNWISAGTVITTDRKISAISGNHITLDAPVADSLDTTYLGSPAGTMSKYTWSGRISQVGLEHLRIQAPAVDADYISVYMDSIIDSWVRDVTIQDGVNSFTVQTGAKRVTVDSVNITRTLAINDVALPWDFSCDGTQILFNKCQSSGSGVWSFMTGGESTGPMVLLNFYSTENTGISPHQRWSTALLSDNCSLPNAPSGTQGISYRNRSNHGSGQGWTTGWSVAWNVVTPYFLVSAAPGTENWCIGGIGTKTSTTDPDGIYDHLGSIVTPQSLYLEQLKERLGGQAVENIGYTMFTINATPSAQPVNAGSAATFTVNVGDPTLMSNVVALSVSGLPAGATAQFSPASVQGAGSSTLTITTSTSTPVGTYTITTTGTCASLTHTDTISLTVTGGSLPGGWTDADVGAVGLGGGAGYSSGTYTVSGSGSDIWNAGDQCNYAYQSVSGDTTVIARVAAENGTQTFAKAGVMIRESTDDNAVEASVLLTPSNGVGMQIRPATGAASINVVGWVTGVVPPQWVKLVRSGSTFTSYYSANGTTWTQFAATNVTMTMIGYTAGLAVTAHDNTSLNTATFDNVSITTLPPDFSLSASPASLTILQGNNGTSTITVNPVHGFNGSVSLSASGLPSGVTAGFNPSSTTSSSTLTLTASSTATTGTATVTITGTSGGLTRTTTISLTITAPDFSLSASPSSLAVTQGNNGTSAITVNPINGFNSSVSLSASGLPSGVTASFNPSNTTSSSTLTLTASSTATTGTATVTVTGTSGSLTHTTTISLTVNAAGGSLPSGWTDADVGAGGLAGSASYSAGTFTVSGSGADIWSAGDQFNYAYQSVSGDQIVIARVVSETSTQSFAKAGVMIRETLATNSVEASVLLTPTNGVALEIRPATGAASINVAGWVKGPVPAQWVKLVRSGSTFTGYYSADGSTWTQVAATNVTMNSSATAGLAVTSHDNTSLNTAVFDNVSIGVGIDTAAIYQLQNEASGLVLNNQGSLTNGSKITQWSSVSSDNLRWTFIPTSGGYYQINSVKSGLDAVVQSASTAAGAGIIQYAFGAAGNDQWQPTLNGDGSYTFVNLHSGLVMGDPGASTSTSTQMDQETSNGGSNQKWILIPQ